MIWDIDLIEDLNNSYIVGKDNYPKLLEASLKLLARLKVNLREVGAMTMALGQVSPPEARSVTRI
jgi:hypothetical protein